MGWRTAWGSPVSGDTSQWASSGITNSDPVGCQSAYERRTQQRLDSNITVFKILPKLDECLWLTCRLLLCGPEAQVLS